MKKAKQDELKFATREHNRNLVKLVPFENVQPFPAPSLHILMHKGIAINSCFWLSS
jgi:hypothetical protein